MCDFTFKAPIYVMRKDILAVQSQGGGVSSRSRRGRGGGGVGVSPRKLLKTECKRTLFCRLTVSFFTNMNMCDFCFDPKDTGIRDAGLFSLYV